MALKVFDTKDAVPESLRETAIETKDGKFAISEEEDVTPLRTTLEKERKRANDEEKARKAAETARLELERRLEGQQVGLTEAQQKEYRDKVKADLEQEYKPLKDIEVEHKALKRLTLLDNPVKETMLSEKVGVRGERQAALWTLIKDRFDLTADGKPMVKDHPGLSVEQYLASEVKKEYPEFYKGTQAAGGGAGGSSGDGKGGMQNSKPPTQWTSEERRTFIETQGVQAYNELLATDLRDRSRPKAAAK
jgi:hypothetical protein